MARTFLDWEPKPLDRAAQALVEAIEAQPGAWWYVLPGKRAVRQFEEALVRHLPAHLEPPRGVSQGAWLEALRPSNQPVIDRREAIHAWAAVLRGLTSKECLLALGREAPAPDAAGAWWSLGQRARDLHAELCQADLGFSDLALALPGQAKRWGLWQTLRDRYVQSLQDAGIVDGMELGRSPLVGPEVRLAWIFVPTATVVERKALAAMADRVHSWVLAPASHADRFDAFGLLLPEAWSTETLPLSLDRWHVERGPKQQVDRVLALLREWSTVPRAGSPLAASDIQLGTPDSELKPHLVRGLERVGLQARDAAGRALAQSSAALLVSALAKVLPDFRFQDVARLFRHPDLEPVLSAAVPGQDLAACLDEHHRRHLPLHLRDVAPSDSKLTRWLAVLREQLGGLAEPGEKPLGEWVSAIRTFLGWVYGSRRFAPHLEEQRASQATLEEFSRVLSHWNSAASPWLPQVHAEHALGLLVGELAGRNLPPLGSGEENETLEMLGWRELLWDDAPALILTGFHEGALPEAYPEDVLLPPAARRALGLADAQARMVRDLYLLRCLLGVREVCHLVSGRISEAGDPLRPSRLAFFVPEDQVPSAMQHALGSDVTHHGEAMGELESSEPRRLPRLARMPQLTRISVTDFQSYLASPYLYSLQRLLKLETEDDRDRELDARGFGNLLHGVMEDFGNSEGRHSTDAGEIQAALEGFLDRRVARQFGQAALPAVQLQIHGLKRRIAWVAQTQAKRAQEGWRIVEVEWKAPDPGPRFEVGGRSVELVGRIDRIDHHPLHGYAILDYKTGDKRKDPEREHRKGRSEPKEWVNLQLPLYTFLAQSLTQGIDVQVGYFSVGGTPEAVQIQTVNWSAEVLQSAWARATEIVAAIQAGAFEHNPRARVYEPQFEAIVGSSLAMESEDGSEEEEA